MQGGLDTPLNKAYLKRGDQKISIDHPHLPTEMQGEDVLVTECGGGAGVGRPEERDPEAVRIDVKNELVSLERAKTVFKVVLHPESLAIDHEATRALRGSK